MKKYACHRVYDAPDRYFKQSVVSIANDGKVCNISPLTDETAGTEWIGGIIVLSDSEELCRETSFANLLHKTTNAKQSCYAWHLSHFDFEREELTPQTIIRRL